MPSRTAAVTGLLAAALAACASSPTGSDGSSASGPARPPHAPTPEQHYFEWTSLRFAPEVYAARRGRLIDALRADGGGVLLAPSAEGRSHGGTFRQLDDFLYFTGLELPDSVLVIDADARAAAVYAPRRDARFESAARPNDFPGRPLADDPELARVTGLDVWPIEELDRAPLEARSAPRSAEHVARLRMVKGPEEIRVLRRACAITCASIREAAARVEDGVDERTLEGVLEAGYKARGAQRPAFDSIVKSGPNSLWPWRILAAHYDRRNRVMGSGELVIFDVGCELDHYASDVGRTFPVSGRFTASQREALELSTAVADAVMAAVRPGVTLAELQRVADARIPAERKAYMQTGLFFGHHIGLDVGDPSLAEEPLAPGMVFTIEPWYYDHDTGLAVFVEDDVLVTATGCENLSAALPRLPRELERMVGAGR